MDCVYVARHKDITWSEEGISGERSVFLYLHVMLMVVPTGNSSVHGRFAHTISRISVNVSISTETLKTTNLV